MSNRVGFFCIWYMHRCYYCLPPPHFLLCTAERFRSHLEKIVGKAHQLILSPQHDHFHFYIYNAKMFPVLFSFRCLQEIWWPDLCLAEQLGMAPGAMEMGRGCEQCCCLELALLPLCHWARSPLSWLNVRISVLCSAVWPDLAGLFQVSNVISQLSEWRLDCLEPTFDENNNSLNGELLEYSNLGLLESPPNLRTVSPCCLLCAVYMKSARKSVWRRFDCEEVGGYLHLAVSQKTL